VASRRITAIAGVAAVLLIAIIIVAGGGSSGHTVKASFDSAVQLAPGQEVRVAGRKVGEIGKVEISGGHSVVELKIREDDVWPLHRGTTANTRWGSTTSLAYRYVEVQPGPRSQPELADGALLPQTETKTAFELDQAYRIFRGRTRSDFKVLVGELAHTLQGRASALREGLRDAGNGLDQTSALMHELAADDRALRTLVTAGDTATSALASRPNDLSGLVVHAAQTFDELAQHARAQQAALDRAPRAFNTATDTLGRLDTSLVGLQALVDDIRPGARDLRTLATPTRRAVNELRSVAPLATATLRRGRLAAPDLQRLLKTGTDFLPQLGTALKGLDPIIGCLRPYAPEIAGMMSTWSGYNKNYDAGGHYARTFPLMFNAALVGGTPLNSLQITRTYADRLFYAMPRPPGLNAGQPWFLPQCGAGPESVDPAKDPEGAGK
jgi:phospholipid/cholesterol/gamma-HCH transport system substrate-binding protein